MSIILFTQDHGRTRRDIELQPALVILGIERVAICEMLHRVVGQSVAAKLLGIRIEHYLPRALAHQQPVVGIGP